MTDNQSGAEDQRWEEIHRLLAAHPTLATQSFWDDFYRAVKDLVNGDTEQVCLQRRQDQGPVRVDWSPVTVGQRENWSGTGPG